jgi:sigma-54 dependent transcriptional regulator, acetoin dehydrogenase operon transcriptional activator AcoR
VQRPEIARSWRRAELAGLDPALPIHRLGHQEFDRRSRLLLAATPVLDAIAENLAGTAFSVALADRDARIVARRFGQARLEHHLDALGITPGRRFTEETTGTNAIATVHELRSGVTVHGEEHYVESLRRFSCYGHPIVHPATGRLDGILDITCPAEQATELLKPFLTRGVRDIERMLLEGAREAEHRLMRAFHAASARGRQPVLALAEDVVLANPAAMELLEPADHAALRGLAADLPRAVLAHRLTLSSGREATVRVEPVPSTGGALFTFALADERPSIPRRAPDGAGARLRRTLAALRDRRARVLLCGEPGTGRSTAARLLAGDAPVEVLDAAADPGGFEATVLRMLDDRPGLLLLEHVDLLPPAVAVRVMRAVDEGSGWVAATSAPVDGLSPEHAALAVLPGQGGAAPAAGPPRRAARPGAHDDHPDRSHRGRPVHPPHAAGAGGTPVAGQPARAAPRRRGAARPALRRRHHPRRRPRRLPGQHRRPPAGADRADRARRHRPRAAGVRRQQGARREAARDEPVHALPADPHARGHGQMSPRVRPT